MYAVISVEGVPGYAYTPDKPASNAACALASSPSKSCLSIFLSFGVNLVLYTLFINVTLVECLPILACVGHVFGIVCREIMSPREILFGTHVNVIVTCVIQHTINAFDRRYADGARRQTDVSVRIIR